MELWLKNSSSELLIIGCNLCTPDKSNSIIFKRLQEVIKI